MSDYLKIEVGFVASENSDYSDPENNVEFDPYEALVEGYESFKREIGTSNETVELGQYSTINELIVKNLDPTNYVTATFRSAGNGSTDNIIRIGAGKFAILPDVTPGNDLVLVANGAACLVRIAIAGET